MQIRPGDGSNTIGISRDADGLDPMPISHACEDCGEVWTRPAPDESFAVNGARYFIGKRWLCVACMLK